MQDHKNLTPLADLGDYELQNENQDVRGCTLLGAAGQPLGRIQDLLVDRSHDRVAAVRVDDGATFPVEALERRGQVVVVRATDRAGTAVPPTDGETVIPLVQEEMIVGKRAVDRGTVQVSSRVVSEPVQESVSLREERVTLERRPVDAQGTVDPARAFEEKTVSMRQTGEEPVVVKEAQVVEEVVLRKDVQERVEDIEGTVRHTEVDVKDGRANPQRT